MDFRSMRVDADLNRFHPNVPDSRRLALANHDGVGLELHAELPLDPRILKNLEEVLADKDLATAQCQYEYASICHLVEQSFDLGGVHLAMIVMIEVTVDAPFIASIGEIELHAEGDLLFQRLLAHLQEQPA